MSYYLKVLVSGNCNNMLIPLPVLISHAAFYDTRISQHLHNIFCLGLEIYTAGYEGIPTVFVWHRSLNDWYSYGQFKTTHEVSAALRSMYSYPCGCGQPKYWLRLIWNYWTLLCTSLRVSCQKFRPHHP